MGYACFTDDGNQAAIIVTNLENGDTLGVCPEHLTDYALGLLQSVTDVEWQPVLTDVADAGGTPAADLAGEADDQAVHQADVEAAAEAGDQAADDKRIFTEGGNDDQADDSDAHENDGVAERATAATL